MTSYWEMAASLVLRGALHEELFFDCSGEMYCVFAKFKPYLADIRKKLPYFLLNVEAVAVRNRGRAAPDCSGWKHGWRADSRSWRSGGRRWPRPPPATARRAG